MTSAQSAVLEHVEQALRQARTCIDAKGAGFCVELAWKWRGTWTKSPAPCGH